MKQQTCEYFCGHNRFSDTVFFNMILFQREIIISQKNGSDNMKLNNKIVMFYSPILLTKE